MGAGFEDKQRQVIPRWRAFKDTVSFGETSPGGSRKPSLPPGSHELLARKRVAWQQTGDAAHASDLIATAVVSGELSEANDAAAFVLEEGARVPVGLRDVAVQMRAVTVVSAAEAHDAFASAKQVGAAVREARSALVEYPQNPVLWVDLARLRTLLGDTAAAARNMTVALSLAPDSRFVLRSAARLFVHLGEPDQAHELLRNHPRTSADPWLLGAEIAVADAADRRSRHLSKAQAMIASKRFPPFALSELAGAIGTEEALSGNRKQAKRLFRLALEEPTENVVAQAVWVARHTKVIQVDEQALATPHSHEAHAWTFFSSRNWEGALLEAKRWFVDQPFSGRPAVMATYLAAVPLGRHREAVVIARAGLRANPHDTFLLNNLAFSLASIEDIAEAKLMFKLIGRESVDTRTTVMLTATQGLLAYRDGDPAAGRVLYGEAIRMAQAHQLVKQAALAAAYLAREEIRAKSSEAGAAVELGAALAASADCEEAHIILRAVESSRGRLP